jgi:hypothetical protein
MLSRLGSSLFWALVFAILVPLAWLLLAGMPFDSWLGVLLLGGAGAGLGALFGWLFPGVFRLLLEFFVDY